MASGGAVLTSFAGVAYLRDLALDSSGRVDAVGWYIQTRVGNFIAVGRYTPNGQLNASFGSAGQTTTSFPFPGESSCKAYAVVIQPNDGKILVAGSAQNPNPNFFALARFNPNGTMDSFFGQGGFVGTAFMGTGGGEAFGIALYPTGTFVVAGYWKPSSSDPSYFALGRYFQ